jgi:hypothetical protein
MQRGQNLGKINKKLKKKREECDHPITEITSIHSQKGNSSFQAIESCLSCGEKMNMYKNFKPDAMPRIVNIFRTYYSKLFIQ